MKIKLSELAEALRKSDTMQGYVDLEQGEVVLLQEEQCEEDMMDYLLSLEEQWERYIPVPNLHDAEERRAMEGFAETRENPEIRSALEEIVASPRAGRKFRHAVKHMLLLPEWRKYQQQQFYEAARDWCEENQIEYEAD